MEVGDHDFTHFSVVPSLSLILDIPDTVEESWYRVQVIVTGVDLGFSQGGGGGGGGLTVVRGGMAMARRRVHGSFCHVCLIFVYFCSICTFS